MPHMCTRCRSVFDDGMDVLEGCPVCGWKKFLFVKSKEKIKEVRGALNASEIGGPCEPWPEGDDALRKILKATPHQPPNTEPAKTEPAKREPPRKGRKGRSRRSAEGREKQKEIPKPKGTLGFFDLDSTRGREPPPPEGESKNHRIDEGKMLESIRMSEPGTYELNLSSLFERDELVMALKDGTYFIDLSSAFKKSKKG